jgi:hypothetical protein
MGGERKQEEEYEERKRKGRICDRIGWEEKENKNKKKNMKREREKEEYVIE